jgi:hypothetical protein
MHDFEKAAKNYYRQAITAFDEGDVNKCLTLLANSGDNIKIDSQGDLYMKIMHKQAEILRSGQELNVSKDVFEKAQESMNTLISSQSHLARVFERLEALNSEERAGEAIALANKLMPQIAGETLVEAGYWLAASDADLLRIQTESAKAKKALIKARDILEACKNTNVNLLLKAYANLSRLALSSSITERTVQKVRDYCEKGWKAAAEFGYAFCDPIALFWLCKYMVSVDPDPQNTWSKLALQAATEMLDSGRNPFDAAKLYVKSFRSLFDSGEGLTSTLIDKRHALECAKAISGQPNPGLDDKADIAVAYWLVGFFGTKDESWPHENDDTKMSIRILKHSVRLIKEIDLAIKDSKEMESLNNMRALAHNFLAFPYKAKGEDELANNELRKSVRLMERHAHDNPSLLSSIETLKRMLNEPWEL